MREIVKSVIMKKIFLYLCTVVFCVNINTAAPDEGMWLPIFLDSLNYDEMQEMGCHLTPEQIFSINNSSMKDAVVRFGRGCTGEIISENGLLITNHHCGYRQIQSHSSVEHDYLTNGFWARSQDEELPNPGLTVSFLVRMEDVTSRINENLSDDMSEQERNQAVVKEATRIEQEAEEGNHYRASVYSFFHGNEFYLMVYEVFQDVRLVGTPPYAIGKFGADTDNWTWPRHKGDFCLFRIYTGTDGKPAPYSEENIPLKPKHYFPISLDGVQKGDYAMILGYPGSTDRFLTSHGVKMALEKTGPAIVEVRSKKLEIMKEFMDADQEVFLKYASKYAGVSNYWKYFIGQTKQLKQNKVYDKKKALEDKFTQWVNASDNRKAKYGDALTLIEESYKVLSKYEVAYRYYREAGYRGSELVRFAYRFYNILNNATLPEDEKKAELKAITEKHFKDYYLPIDKKTFRAMMTMYYRNVPKEQQPEIIRKTGDKRKGDFSKFTNKIYKKSIFTSREEVIKFIDELDLSALEKDPGFEVMAGIVNKHVELQKDQQEAVQKQARGYRLFVQGLREMQQDKIFYPDANSTMRFTYGTVEDYMPKDAVDYNYYTTLRGVLEKEIPNDWEFHVPEKLKKLYEEQDFGRYAEDGQLIVNFITTNDITGGNSGSPVIDANGNLTGLAFDGNWEAMSGDINYEPELQRTICVDIRYVLFVIDKFAGADYIMEELDIVSGQKKDSTKEKKEAVEETATG